MDLAVRAVRHKVSNDRYRFVDGKYDLDLTYVTNNVIAMSFPAKGLESLWRNEAKDVVKMLSEYHKDAFMILNLSEKKWDHPMARGTLLEFGFRDHHAPPLAMLFQMLTTMHCWLTADEKNVVVIHCVGGKGRTGTVIASYLLFCGRFKTSQESLDYFAQVRSSKANGVVQASQRRYVGYVQEVLSTRRPPTPTHLKLVRIIISNVPEWPGAGGSRIVAQVRHVPSHDLAHSSSNPAIQVPLLTSAGQVQKFEFADCNCWVKSDTLIEFHHQTGLNSLHYMFSFYFHTSFIKGSCIFLRLHEIDRLKKVEGLRFDPDMFINLIFEDMAAFMNVKQLQNERQDAIAAEFYTKALALLPPLPPTPKRKSIFRVAVDAMSSDDVLAPKGMSFLRRRFHDAPDIELQSMAAEPARPPPSTPKQVYWRYGKQCVRESEKTKMEVAKFDMEMSTIHSAPPSCVSVLESTKSEPSISPRGPRTERARASASDLGSTDATITDQRADEDHSSPPTSPRAQRSFFRRIFSRKGTHPRALADCAE